MQLFLDSTDVSEIRRGVSWGVVTGVTTNPTLVAKSGRDFLPLLKEIAEAIDGPISAEVIATDRENMLKEARQLASIHENIVVKLPMTEVGLQVAHQLARENIRSNMTLVFSANQALLAALAGATYVSPFVGRLDDTGADGMELVREIVEIFQTHQLKTKVLAASIRHPRHVIEAALAGADIATVPFKVLEQMLHHPMTDRGLEQFLTDWEQAQQNKFI